MLLRLKQNFILILIACFTLTACAVAFAANAQKDEKKGGSKTVTACLQKGDEADEFSLTGDDGKRYDLRSSAVKLGDHIGHKVTVLAPSRQKATRRTKTKPRKARRRDKKKPAIFRSRV